MKKISKNTKNFKKVSKSKKIKKSDFFVILISGVGGPAGINLSKLFSTHKKVKVIGVDLESHSAGRKFVDKFLTVPKVNDEKYISTLNEIIKKYKVNLFVPTVEEELPIISSQKESIGCEVCISPTASISLCSDKLELYKFFKKNFPKYIYNFSYEKKDFKSESGEYFIKPIKGRGGRGCRKVNELELLSLEKHDLLKGFIVSEFIKGTEFTVDAFVTQLNEVVYTVTRVRLGLTGGITSKAVIKKEDKVLEFAANVLSKISFVGPICLQCILTENGEVKLVEINARCSGGLSTTALAGGDTAVAILNEYRDKKYKKMKFKEITVVRYFEDYIIK